MDCDFIVSKGSLLYATVDLGAYSLTALLRVAHRFTDRCYLHLQFEGEQRVGVRFRGKPNGAELSGIVGEFLNELLDQTLREIVSQETEPVRNLILAHALSDTALIRPELEILDPSEDPLAVATPDDARRTKARTPVLSA
jgi:His-Xaa-Ser system protein HxsD